jgi:hypothetical protein
MPSSSGLRRQPHVDAALWWDVGVTYGNVDHRRPDITCEHPTTHAKYVFDIVV